MLTSPKDHPKPPGPTPETLKIEGDWREAVRGALAKGKPPKSKPKKKAAKKRPEKGS